MPGQRFSGSGTIAFAVGDTLQPWTGRHSTVTLLLDQGIDLVVINELLGNAHIGVTAALVVVVERVVDGRPLETEPHVEAAAKAHPQQKSADVAAKHPKSPAGTNPIRLLA